MVTDRGNWLEGSQRGGSALFMRENRNQEKGGNDGWAAEKGNILAAAAVCATLY